MKNIEIKGIDELNKMLRDLPGKISRKLVFTALRKAAQPMKEEAVNLAPKRTGNIRRAMSIVQNGYEDLPGIMIAPTKGKRATYDAWYARFQEYGTSGFGGRKRSLTSVSVDLKKGAINRQYKTTGYKKRGAGLPAIRFMQRAFESKKEQVLSSINGELGKAIMNHLRKNAPRH